VPVFQARSPDGELHQRDALGDSRAIDACEESRPLVLPGGGVARPGLSRRTQCPQANPVAGGRKCMAREQLAQAGQVRAVLAAEHQLVVAAFQDLLDRALEQSPPGLDNRP
jgi:hypothetical protein